MEAEMKKWYVAIVNNRSELKVADSLDKLGVENYVPVQRRIRVLKGGKAVERPRIVIPAKVFVRCTEAERRCEIVRLPYIYRFMTNRASAGDGIAKPPCVVPPHEIDLLRFMLGQTDIPIDIVEGGYAKGDLVRITRGSLQGLEGEVVMTRPGKSELIVRLDTLGCATLTIDTASLERLTG